MSSRHPIMATYFVSDVHLGLGPKEAEREKEDGLLDFFRGITPDAETLFIVGDLFDFWFEYRTVIPKGFHRTLTALQTLTEQGTTVHYLAGNHDYWMLEFFRTELGIHTHSDPFDITVDGKLIHIHHGDGLSANDRGYKMLKVVLRNRINIALYRWLHPDIGVRLARGSSRTSRDYTAGKDFGEDEGMLAYATRKIEGGVDIVVMGHRHNPVLKTVGRGVYVNLGDWISHYSFARMNQGSIVLKTWNGKQESRNGESSR